MRDEKLTMRPKDVLMDNQLKEDLLSLLSELERFLFIIGYKLHGEIDALWLHDEVRKMSSRISSKEKEGGFR